MSLEFVSARAPRDETVRENFTDFGARPDRGLPHTENGPEIGRNTSQFGVPRLFFVVVCLFCCCRRSKNKTLRRSGPTLTFFEVFVLRATIILRRVSD